MDSYELIELEALTEAARLCRRLKIGIFAWTHSWFAPEGVIRTWPASPMEGSDADR